MAAAEMPAAEMPAAQAQNQDTQGAPYFPGSAGVQPAQRQPKLRRPAVRTR